TTRRTPSVYWRVRVDVVASVRGIGRAGFTGWGWKTPPAPRPTIGPLPGPGNGSVRGASMWPTSWDSLPVRRLFLCVMASVLVAPDALDAQERNTLRVARSDVDSLALTPDERLIVTVDGSFHLKLWDWRTKEKIASLEGQENIDRDVAFSPDGKT